MAKLRTFFLLVGDLKRHSEFKAWTGLSKIWFLFCFFNFSWFHYSSWKATCTATWHSQNDVQIIIQFVLLFGIRKKLGQTKVKIQIWQPAKKGSDKPQTDIKNHKPLFEAGFALILASQKITVWLKEFEKTHVSFWHSGFMAHRKK